jgi:hypothetical protein
MLRVLEVERVRKLTADHGAEVLPVVFFRWVDGQVKCVDVSSKLLQEGSSGSVGPINEVDRD